MGLSICGNSIHSAQFCCEAKTALQMSILKRHTHRTEVLSLYYVSEQPGGIVRLKIGGPNPRFSDSVTLVRSTDMEKPRAFVLWLMDLEKVSRLTCRKNNKIKVILVLVTG